MRVGIGTKVTAGFVLVVLLMTALALFSVNASQAALQDAVGKSSVLLAQEMVTRIYREIHGKIEQLEFYSQNPLLQETVLTSNQELEGLANLQDHIGQKDTEWVSAPADDLPPFMQEVLDNDLSNALRRDFIEFYDAEYGYRVFPEVFVTNKHGLVVASTGRTSDYFQADKEWYQAAIAEGDVWTGEIAYDDSSGAFASKVVINLYDDQGSFAGTLTGMVDEGRIIREAEILAGEYETTGINLITEDGKLIYSTQTFRFLEDVSEMEFVKKIRDQSGFFIVEEGGRDRLVSYAYMRDREGHEGHHWVLVVRHDVAEVLRPAFVLRNNILRVSLVLIVLSVVVALFISRSLTKPIAELISSTNLISRGDLSHRIDVSSRDEIGDLAQAFNDMTADLERRVTELSALNAVAGIVAESLDVDEILNRSMDEPLRILSAEAAAMMLVDKETGELVMVAHRGMSDEFATAFGRMSPGEGLSGQVVQTGEPVIMGDLTEYPGARKAYLEKERIQSAVVVPLIGSAGVIGTMNLGVSSPHDLDDASIEPLLALGQQIAIGVERVRLYEDTRIQAEELREHRDHLEELVEERAAELTRANEALEAEVAERERAAEELKQTLAALEAAQTAALNMMEDADEARRLAEGANENLTTEIAERVRTQVDLERSNKELEQFAYVASHDLQEPLRAVSGFLQLLERRYAGKLDESADKYITRSVAATTRMKTMINDLLTYSRVATLGKAFEPADCSLALDVALANLQTAIEESGTEITHDGLPTLMADGSQLVQLFQNLLANAIKFRGESPSEIHVGAEYVSPSRGGDSSHSQSGGNRSGAHWLFSVRDNGIGIETQYAERIFVIFQRLHTRTEYPGTGIGLAVCQKIVQRHGGRIWVESEPGAGSTFYFTIPEREGGNLS